VGDIGVVGGLLFGHADVADGESLGFEEDL
jgi:hypothetical protein